MSESREGGGALEDESAGVPARDGGAQRSGAGGGEVAGDDASSSRAQSADAQAPDAQASDAPPSDAPPSDAQRSDAPPPKTAPLPLSARKPDPRGNSLSWVHTFRLSPLALVLILATLGGLWYLFETTDLWYRLFP